MNRRLEGRSLIFGLRDWVLEMLRIRLSGEDQIWRWKWKLFWGLIRPPSGSRE